MDTLLGFLGALETYRLDCRIMPTVLPDTVVLNFMGTDRDGNKYSKNHAIDLQIASSAMNVGHDLMRQLLPIMREVWEVSSKE